nr:MFS transporter [Rhodococcus rhodochrous]
MSGSADRSEFFEQIRHGRDRARGEPGKALLGIERSDLIVRQLCKQELSCRNSMCRTEVTRSKRCSYRTIRLQPVEEEDLGTDFFLGGILPLFLLLLCVLALPESASYLATRPDEASRTKARALLRRMTGAGIPDGAPLLTERRNEQAGSVRALFSPDYRVSTMSICAVYLANWIAWFLLLQWMPTALHEAGLSKEAAATGTILVNGGFIVFSFLVTALLTRVAIRTLLLAMFALGIALALGLSVSGANWTLTFTLLTLAGLGIGGQQLVLNYLIVQTFPTQLRGTATGFSIGVGRTGSIIGSALGGWLLTVGGVGGYFAFIAVPLAVAAVATMLLRSRRPGVSASSESGELESSPA